MAVSRAARADSRWSVLVYRRQWPESQRVWIYYLDQIHFLTFKTRIGKGIDTHTPVLWRSDAQTRWTRPRKYSWTLLTTSSNVLLGLITSTASSGTTAQACVRGTRRCRGQRS